MYEQQQEDDSRAGAGKINGGVLSKLWSFFCAVSSALTCTICYWVGKCQQTVNLLPFFWLKVLIVTKEGSKGTFSLPPQPTPLPGRSLRLFLVQVKLMLLFYVNITINIQMASSHTKGAFKDRTLQIVPVLTQKFLFFCIDAPKFCLSARLYDKETRSPLTVSHTWTSILVLAYHLTP